MQSEHNFLFLVFFRLPLEYAMNMHNATQLNSSISLDSFNSLDVELLRAELSQDGSEHGQNNQLEFAQ